MTPPFCSPLRDGGYDVSDFLSIDPSIGSLEDFESLTKAAHQRDLRVITDLLPAIRAQSPDASFHIVGRSPADELLEFHEQDGVYVWGEVEDTRPWLAAADLALIPLEIARGIQTKVLEAMAMSLPVVLTTGAATGVGATDGIDFTIADNDADLIDRVNFLIAHPREAMALGRSAREFVVEHLSWSACLAPLPDLIAGTGPEACHAA